MPLSSDRLTRFILDAFPDANVEIQDLVGDKDHYAATITSQAFIGKSRIEQHQMVYDALQGHMGTTLHALSLKTQVPKE